MNLRHLLAVTSLFLLGGWGTPASAQSVYYVDGIWGDDLFDGQTAVATNGHGPFRTVATAITSASSGSTIQVVSRFCQENLWDLGSKTLNLVMQNNVTVYDSDPFSTYTYGGGIPDAFQYPDEVCRHPWAHGLTNRQVYENPSILTAQDYSTINDGIADWWKVKYGYVLRDPSLGLAAANRNGYTILQQYNYGLAPNDLTNHPPYLPPDFAGWWKFDEGTGTVTVSAVGSNLTGVLTGTPSPAWTSGISSNALVFDGQQNEVTVADNPQLSPTNSLSITAWIKTLTNMTSDVVAKWSPNTNLVEGSYLLSLTNGQVSLALMIDGTYTELVGTTATLSDTNWHHIAGTYDGSSMSVYLDGTCVGTLATNGAVAVVQAALRLGLLAGTLDDVRLYNYALPAAAVAALAAADRDGDGLPDWFETLVGSDSGFWNPDATCPHPWAHGLTNRQVFDNLSVLKADNYCSVLGRAATVQDDEIPDWWKVKQQLSLKGVSP